jgi:CRISPR-associated protein Csy3
MTAEKLSTATVLAFERKLANSDGFMYSGNWSDELEKASWSKISVETKDVRGVISNRLKNAIASDEMKLDAEIQKANLQRVDTASLPEDADTLKLNCTLRVLGDLAMPSVCNSPAYQEKLASVINAYIDKFQFKELAGRYAQNIANGRFLWRNRLGAEAIHVHVKHIVNQSIQSSWTFNAYDHDLRTFDPSASSIQDLAEVIQSGLLGNSFALLDISAYVRLGKAQEVFPSQELVLDSAGDSKKSKYLYQVNNVAAMHSQKIGNALRTIDTWYPEGSDLGPIAVEPYGSVTSRGKAYRQPRAAMDFYTLLDKWILKDQEPDEQQQHYVMAMLIRGGVFGESDK